jgi:hypothetical protein
MSRPRNIEVVSREDNYLRRHRGTGPLLHAGETLVPIMQELGADPGEPQVAEVHNVIVG